MIDQKLQRFFTEFERVIGEHDFEKLGALYADSFISAGPSGNAIRTRADLLAQARNASTFYESVGQTSLKILSMQQTPITECYSLVKVSWGATFRATGDRVVEFVDSYVVQVIEEAPKIIALIAHQDERAVLKRLGVIDI
ncbi:MAG: nuclear transport factor 2 family protein [Halobacteriota archaeon]